MFYVGKGLQAAGLIAVGVALYTGIARSDADGAMARELGGSVFGFALFWAGRMLESPVERFLN